MTTVTSTTGSSTTIAANQIATDYFITKRATFTDYYNAFAARLLTHATKFTKDSDTANMIVNDVLMKVGCGITTGQSKPYTYDPSRSHVSYLMTATMRACINHNNKKINRDTLYESASNVDESENSNGLLAFYGYLSEMGDQEEDMSRENGIMLKIGTHMLTLANDPVLSDAIISRAMEEMEYQDIVDRYPDEVNTVGAVKTRVSRFRKNLGKTVSYYNRYKRVMNEGSLESGKFVAFKMQDEKSVYLYRKGTFSAGSFNDWVEEFYPDGSLKSKIKYNHGIVVGIARYYDENGDVCKLEKYSDDGYISNIKTYENGEIREELEFEGPGVLVYSCTWDENGEIIDEQLL